MIYVVTEGSYSDYRINAVFSTRELAEEYTAYAALHGERGTDIEEYDLDPFIENVRAGLACYQVFFDNILQGDIEEVNDWGALDPSPDYAPKHRDGRTAFCAFVLTTDEQSARKIANERRLRYVVEHNL